MKLPTKFGAQSEKRIAKLVGGRTRPASGAKWFARGDISNKTHLIQAKATAKRQYVLKLADLQLIEQQAAGEDKEAALIVEFSTPQGRYLYRIERHYV